LVVVATAIPPVMIAPAMKLATNLPVDERAITRSPLLKNLRKRSGKLEESQSLT
jgi:hypothetical protein